MILVWTGGGLRLRFDTGADAPVRLVSARPDDREPRSAVGVPLVEVQALGHGRFPGSHRYADTAVGARLRYRGHEQVGGRLRVTQSDPVTGLVATSVFERHPGVPAVRTWTEVTVEGAGVVRLQAVTSVVTGAFVADSGQGVDELDVVHGDSDWVAESRWSRSPLRSVGLVRMDPVAHHHPPRGRFPVTSRGSWSTGERLPTGVLVARDDSWALAWQIEHNGAWHWEVGETVDGAYLALLGPTDAEHQWSVAVSRGQPFTSVPVSIAVAGGGVDAALGALTAQRRAGLRRVRRPDLPVIFNDYMNTLMGDPTTAKLLPLIDAAAAAGAEYFCVDAGWYDEDGRWWDSVGEWLPSATRFPGGLGEVLDRVRDRGMLPGLWLEPEVVGVRSPLAERLPAEAFFQRDGVRVVEHGRHHLDLRHPAAVAHLDEVVDRVVGEYGAAYLKLDYNISPGPGTDVGGSPGAGLLEHNRAHLAWLDAVLERHPGLLVENCASGGMRMDYALLSLAHIQSTSDQQNPLLYPAIAAAAPASVLPEQAGNWAYAQPEMDPEAASHTLVGGILGRLYLAGRLDLMSAAQLDLVAEAVSVHKGLRGAIARGVPCWPLGLAGPHGPWQVLGLRDGAETLLTLWRGPEAGATLDVPLPHLRDIRTVPTVLFPRAAQQWSLEWCGDRGVLRVTSPRGAQGGRVIRLAPA
ncbi:alpha-galactosidase [Actinokineospora sp. 24-640]